MVAGKMWRAKPRKQMRRKRMPLSKAQAKAVRKIANTSGEIKKVETNNDDTDIYSGASSSIDVGLTNIIQGDGDSQRIGDKLNIKKLLIRGVLDAKSSQSALCRLYIIQALFDTTGSGLTTIKPDEFFPDSEAVGGRYKVLYDKIMTVNPNGNEKKFFKVSLNGNKFAPVKYDAAATSINYGRVFCSLLTDDNVTTGNLDMDCNVKLYYTDA